MSREVGFRIYLVSDGEDEGAIEAALGALPAGGAALQLRAHGLEGRALLARARRLRAITRATGSLLLVNDRIDVAIAAEADGAHLPARGLPAEVARRVAGELLLGVSTHSLEEARRAEAGGADLVTFGPVWATATHPDARPTGVAALAEVVRGVQIPVFALGGVDAQTAGEAVAAGARVACLRGLRDARAIWEVSARG